MRISKLSSYVSKHIASGSKVPLWLWGPPGIGKSDLIRQVADQLGMRLIDRRAVTFDSVDVRGVPIISTTAQGHDCTKWSTPDFLQSLHDGVPTLLFWDELAQAPPTVQAALLQLTLDRRLDGFTMPPNVVQIAASNRMEDRAGVGRVITPLLNRFMHLNLDVSVEDWMAWAINHDIDVTIRSFINFRTALLMNFDPRSTEKAFASPRSWSFANDAVKLGLDHGTLQEVLAGTVGSGPASEFVGFLNAFQKIPDINQIKASPASAPVPGAGDPDVCWALIGKLTDELRKDASWMNPYCEYAVRFPKEFTALAVRDGAVARQAVITHTTFVAWMRANKDAINGEI